SGRMHSPGRPSRPALGRCRFRPGLLDRRAPSHARPAPGVRPDRPESQARRTPGSLALPQEHAAPGMAQHGSATRYNPAPRACARTPLRRAGCPRRRADRQPDAEQGRQLFRTPRLDPPRLRQLRLVRRAVAVAAHRGRAEILVRGGRLPRDRRPCPGAAWSSLRLDLPSQPDHRQRCQHCGHLRAEVSTRLHSPLRLHWPPTTILTPRPCPLPPAEKRAFPDDNRGAAPSTHSLRLHWPLAAVRVGRGYDRGEPSGAVVAAARRAASPWPEQMARKMLRFVEIRGIRTDKYLNKCSVNCLAKSEHRGVPTDKTPPARTKVLSARGEESKPVAGVAQPEITSSDRVTPFLAPG